LDALIAELGKSIRENLGAVDLQTDASLALSLLLGLDLASEVLLLPFEV